MRKVLIGVLGGVAEVMAHPPDIEVEIRDFDNNECLDLEEGQAPEDHPDYVKDFTDEELEAARNS